MDTAFDEFDKSALSSLEEIMSEGVELSKAVRKGMLVFDVDTLIQTTQLLSLAQYSRERYTELAGIVLDLSDNNPERTNLDLKGQVLARFWDELILIKAVNGLDLLPEYVPLIENVDPTKNFDTPLNDYLELRQTDLTILIRRLQRDQHMTKRAANVLATVLKPVDYAAEIDRGVQQFVDIIETIIREHIPNKVQATASMAKDLDGKTKTLVPETSALTVDKPLAKLYLTGDIKLCAKVAKKHLQVAIEHLEETYEGLRILVGDETAQNLIQKNPDILHYGEQNQLGKYLRAIAWVQKTAAQHFNGNGCPEEYSPQNNLRGYSTLEGILELKLKLYDQIRPPEKEEDVPAKKRNVFAERLYHLAEQTNLNPYLLCAIVSGQNAQAGPGKGLRPEIMKKNARYALIDTRPLKRFDKAIKALVSCGALVERRGSQPSYSWTPDPATITDEPIRAFLTETRIYNRG